MSRNSTSKCENCIHNEVCKFRADLAAAGITAANTFVPFGEDSGCRIMNLPFVEGIEVHCKFYK